MFLPPHLLTLELKKRIQIHRGVTVKFPHGAFQNFKYLEYMCLSLLSYFPCFFF